MSNSNSGVKSIKQSLEKLSGIEKISSVEIKDNIVKRVTINSALLGKLTINHVRIKDSLELYKFYFQSLSKAARIFFCPYPIFNPPPENPQDLGNKIKNWRKESDWTLLKLSKGTKLIGVCLLKRYKTSRPTSGLAVHEKFQKMGLGILLQSVINEQARLLKIKKLTITIAPDNEASFKVHQKAGFKRTDRIVPHFTYIKGVKTIDRHDIEMIKRFSYK